MDSTANLKEKSLQDYNLDEGTFVISRQNIHGCPGGRNAHCGNCGFKEPCCGD